MIDRTTVVEDEGDFFECFLVDEEGCELLISFESTGIPNASVFPLIFQTVSTW